MAEKQIIQKCFANTISVCGLSILMEINAGHASEYRN